MVSDGVRRLFRRGGVTAPPVNLAYDGFDLWLLNADILHRMLRRQSGDKLGGGYVVAVEPEASLAAIVGSSSSRISGLCSRAATRSERIRWPRLN